MALRLRCAVLASLALLPATLGSAQEQTSQTFAEEIEVRVVDIDVVVTDARGRPITGLKREDFELLEDGKPVQIRYFTPVSGGSLQDPAVAEPEAVRATASPDTNRAPVTWVVFIDQTNMAPGSRKHALVSLRNFLEASLAPGDRGLVASNDGLALRIKQNITNERRLLLDALTKLQKERVHQGPWTLRASQIRNDLRSAVKVDASGNTGPSVSPEVVNAEYFAEHLGTQITLIMNEEAQRTRNAIRSMDALVDALADVGGRLALVYVGAGFNTYPALELIDIWRAKYPEKMGALSAPDPEQHRQALQDDVDRLFANLSATRVSVYAIHAAVAAGVSVQDAGPDVMDMNRGMAGDRAQLTEAALTRDMSERTGGLYFKINPGLTRQLAAVRSDLDHYYSLGYVPTGEQGDARRIEVRVNTDGARVRHRAIVRERSRPEEAGRAAVASLLQPTKTIARKAASPAAPATLPSEANPLGVQVEAMQPRRDGSSTDHFLPFDLKLGSLMFAPKGSVYRADFVLHFALVEPNGTIWPVESRVQSLEIPNAEVPTSPDHYASFVWSVDLSALRVPKEVPIKAEGMKLMVTVEDRNSHIRSVITVPVQKPGRPYYRGDEATLEKR